MNYSMSVDQVKTAIKEKLSHIYGVSSENASNEEFYKASALVVRDLLMRGRNEFVQEAEKQETKQVYYLCMEFLLGRSLKNNLFNLGLEKNFRTALSEMGVKLDHLYEQEPDAGLGNGGLGRLAACYLDSMSTLDLAGMGYGLRYDYGIFKQRIVNGCQVEEPDHWLKNGYPWEMMRPEYSQHVHFGGHVECMKENGREKPWKVQFLAVGNESWGCGGEMTPEFYADNYRRYQTFCRNYGDNHLLKVAGGANVDDYNWTEVLMKRQRLTDAAT